MGTSAQSVQQKVDSQPSPLDWVLITQNTFKRYRNRQTREEVEEYTFMPSGQLSYDQELVLYQYRKKQNHNIVSIHYVQRITGVNMCSGNEFYKVWVEYIPFRLSDIKQLSIPQIIFVLRESILGFQKILQHYGPINIKQQLIGINKIGKIKVWLTQNFQQNQPSQIQTLKIHKMKLKYGQLVESEMVKELIKVVENCIIGRIYPQRLKILMMKQQKMTFSSLFNILREYSVEESIILPQRLYIDIEETGCNNNYKSSMYKVSKVQDNDYSQSFRSPIKYTMQQPILLNQAIKKQSRVEQSLGSKRINMINLQSKALNLKESMKLNKMINITAVNNKDFSPLKQNEFMLARQTVHQKRNTSLQQSQLKYNRNFSPSRISPFSSYLIQPNVKGCFFNQQQPKTPTILINQLPLKPYPTDKPFDRFSKLHQKYNHQLSPPKSINIPQPLIKSNSNSHFYLPKPIQFIKPNPNNLFHIQNFNSFSQKQSDNNTQPNTPILYNKIRSNRPNISKDSQQQQVYRINTNTNNNNTTLLNSQFSISDMSFNRPKSDNNNNTISKFRWFVNNKE